MRGGWGHPQGDKQMAAAGLTVEKPCHWVGQFFTFFAHVQMDGMLLLPCRGSM